MSETMISQQVVERGILERAYRINGKTEKRYRVEKIWDPKAKKRVGTTKTFTGKGALQAARSFRSAQEAAVNRGELQDLQGKATVAQAAWCYLEAVVDGRLTNDRGEPYKPSVLRQYETVLRLRVLPKWGSRQLTSIRPGELQGWIDDMRADGLAPATISNTLNPLAVIYRTAIRREFATIDPTKGLQLPRGATARDRIATPEEAAKLVAALPDPHDRALWATALYAGLRRGELMGLRWADVDFEARLIHVSRAYDDRAKQFIEPKTRNAKRSALMPAALLALLMAIRPVPADGWALVFPSIRDAGAPFNDGIMRKRARKAWAEAGLEAIGFHECRHTCASWMIYAELNIKEVSTRLGHASVQITLDRYGHLLPGGELEALGLLDDFLGKAA